MLGDYFDSPASPLYPFGHGLSYTTFAYDDVTAPAASTREPIVVTCTVRNTGTRAGIEVVQCYVRDEVARCARPRKQLAGFARVELEPGSARSVRFTIDPTLLAYYDEDMRLVVEPGTVRVMLGGRGAVVEMQGEEREISPNDRIATSVDIA